MNGEKSMNGQDMQAGQLLENEAVRRFLQLLTEDSPGKGQDYSMILWQMDIKCSCCMEGFV